MADNGGMVDNDEALGGMLYSAWAGNDSVPPWGTLSQGERWRWFRVCRLIRTMEVDLCAKLARDSYRKRFEVRLLERLAKWDAGK